MSVFIGTEQTSIYAVYNSAISLINSLINAALAAPQNSLGQIINTETEKAKKIVHEYEFTAILVAMILFSTTMAMILPFVRMYTSGVNDADYIHPQIAILMVIIAVLQIIHIPSGRCIELSGNFKAVRNIQSVTFVLLATLSAIGAAQYGVIGLLVAKMITNIVLAAMEIVYAHSKVVCIPVKNFLRVLVPNLLIASSISWIEYTILKNAVLSWGTFILAGFALVLLNSLVAMTVGILFYRSEMVSAWERYSRVLHLKK